MADHTLDIPKFRLIFPEFSNPVDYPDEMIEMYWELATSYMCAYDNIFLSGSKLQNALYFLTAHLLWLATAQDPSGSGAGSAGGVEIGATIDKVSVSMAAPPFKTGWQYWLNQSKYGQMLWALLSVASAGGFYFGGRPERLPFRKVGGVFRGPPRI